MKSEFYDLSDEQMTKMEQYAGIVAQLNGKQRKRNERSRKKDALGERLCLLITLPFPILYALMWLEVIPHIDDVLIWILAVGVLDIILARIFGFSTEAVYKKVISIIAIIACAIVTFICAMNETEFLEAIPCAIIPCVQGWLVVKFIFWDRL